MQTPEPSSKFPAPKLNLERIRQFLAFYKKMPRSQKASLLAFAFMVFAIPFSVTASLNQIRSRSKAATPISAPVTPRPSAPPPSTPPPSPTPPSYPPPSTPPPSPTPPSYPPPSPRPSILPSPTPKPINIPVLMTQALPIGYLNISYQAVLSGYTLDSNIGLNLTATALPKGLTLNNCSQTTDGTKNTLTCYISGKPIQSGDFPITITLSDAFSVSVTKKLTLKIQSQKFKIGPINWIYEKLN